MNHQRENTSAVDLISTYFSIILSPPWKEEGIDETTGKNSAARPTVAKETVARRRWRQGRWKRARYTIKYASEN